MNIVFALVIIYMQIDFDGNEIFLKIYYFHLYNIKNDIILLHVELLFEKLILHN